ncbi:MAG: ribonuclease P protein component [Candidatus Gracilibacteria bacterium]
MKRSKRIQGKPLVQALLKEGASTSHPFFILIKKENGLDRTRYCIIMSKKLEKSAVKRNKKRRQIYEIIRILEKESLVPSQPTFDIVLIARKPAVTASFDELQKSLRALLTTLAGKSLIYYRTFSSFLPPI